MDNTLTGFYFQKQYERVRQVLVSGNLITLHRWAQRTVTFDLLRDLLPGPVTTVFERSSQLNAQLNPGTALVGIRVPDHPIARQLAARCGHPLALTSANISDAGNTVAVEVSWGLW